MTDETAETPVMVCEDGAGVCEATQTDCCEDVRPACQTTDVCDPNGDVLVTVCRNGFGCGQVET